MSPSDKRFNPFQISCSPKTSTLNFSEEVFTELHTAVEQVSYALNDYLAKLTNIDQFVSERHQEVDEIFANQHEIMSKSAFVQQIKEDLVYYISYFDNERTDDEVFDTMYDKVSEIEKKYKILLATIK